MARIQPASQQFQIARAATAAALHGMLIATAREKHAEVMARAPRPVVHFRSVDGSPGKPVEQVRPNGVITFEYPRLDIVAGFALTTLRQLSPVRSGDYKNAHQIFINDAAVDDFSGWRPGDQVLISNFVPYARKIEVGAMKMRVPGTDHVYAQAERIVRRQYGNFAGIKFTYRGISGSAELRGATVVAGAAGNKSAIRYPALVFTER